MRFSIPVFALFSSIVVAGCSGPMDAGEPVPPAEQLGQTSQALSSECYAMIKNEMDWAAAAPTNEDRWIEAFVSMHFQDQVYYSAPRLDYKPASGWMPARLATTAGSEQRMFTNFKMVDGNPFDPSRTVPLTVTLSPLLTPSFKTADWGNINVTPMRCEKALLYGFGDANAPHMLFSVSFKRHADQMPY